jgi:outer membrane protein assembly factor BamB
MERDCVIFYSLALLILLLSCDDSGDSRSPGLDQQWLGFGGNPNNTSHAVGERKISPESLRKRGLAIKWVYDTRDENDCNGSLSHPPTIYGGYAYFTTFLCNKNTALSSGYLHVVNIETGQMLWKREIGSYANTIDNAEFERIRVAPAVHGDMLVVGIQNTIALRFNPFERDAQGRLVDVRPELGAYVLAIDRLTGDLLWATEVDDHPLAVITQSPTIAGDTVYAGVSAPEYFAFSRSGDSSIHHDCCTGRGSLVALDVRTGTIQWKTFMTPVSEEDKDKIPLNINRDFFTGASIWGNQPVVDEERGLVYVGTGNNSGTPREAQLCERKRRSIVEAKVYGPDSLPAELSTFDLDYSLSAAEDAELEVLLAARGAAVGKDVVCGAIPGEDESGAVRLNDAFPATVNARGEKTFGNYVDAIVALHTIDKPELGAQAGDVAWAFRSVEYDFYRGGGCAVPPGYCPHPFGDDADFTNGPMLVTTPSGRDMLIATTKETRVFAVDPDTGREIWNTRINTRRGWPDWKPATDGQRVYVSAVSSGSPQLVGTINLPSGPYFTNIFDFPDDSDFVDFPAGHLHFMCVSGRDEKRTNCSPAVGTSVDILEKGTVGGYRLALDIETGNILWEGAGDNSGVFIDENGDGMIDDPQVSYTTGGLTVANGVLFESTGDVVGTVQARDAATGEVIWSYAGLGAPVFTHPAVVDGVVYWGGGYHFTAGGLEQSDRDGGQLIAFELPPP